MVIGARISDHYKNRGWVVQFGGVLSTIGFLIYLVVPSTNHPARFAALILAEVGHYSKSRLDDRRNTAETKLTFQSRSPCSLPGSPTMPETNPAVPSPSRGVSLSLSDQRTLP